MKLSVRHVMNKRRILSNELWEFVYITFTQEIISENLENILCGG